MMKKIFIALQQKQTSGEKKKKKKPQFCSDKKKILDKKKLSCWSEQVEVLRCGVSYQCE